MEDALEEFNCELLGDPASSEGQQPLTEPEQHQQEQQQVSESTTTTATGEISTDDLMRAASDLLAEQAVLAPSLEDSGDGLGDGLPLGLDELNSPPYRARCNTWPRLQNFGSFNPADFGGSDGNSNSNPATSSEATNSTAGSSGEVVHPVDALEPYAQNGLALTSNLPLVGVVVPQLHSAHRGFHSQTCWHWSNVGSDSSHKELEKPLTFWQNETPSCDCCKKWKSHSRFLQVW